jgi:hypothetical protein
MTKGMSGIENIKMGEKSVNTRKGMGSWAGVQKVK